MNFKLIYEELRYDVLRFEGLHKFKNDERFESSQKKKKKDHA